jgi:hypothetical protein
MGTQMARSERRTVRQLLLAVVLLMGCGGQADWELVVQQLPTAALPELGQAVYSIPGRNTNLVTGWVVNAEMADFDGKPEIHNVYKLTVDSQEKFYVGQKLTWSNGQGTVLRATHLQPYGVTGEMGVAVPSK